MRRTWVAGLVVILLGAPGCVQKDKADAGTATTATSSHSPTESCFYGQPDTTYSLPPGQVFCGYATTSSTASGAPTTTSSGGSYVVRVQCNYFDPAASGASTGSTFTWQKLCGSHTVTIHRAGDAAGSYLHDDELGGGATQFTFSAAGTYHVFCRFHSNGAGGDYVTGMASNVTVT